MRFLRAFLSIFLSVEMLIGSILSSGSLKTDVPDAEKGEYGRYVNAFVGTGGIPWMCGMLSPAACAPFGSVRLGPDTCAAGGIVKLKTNTSGYYYEHRHILGFSCGRLSGTGARDYGMFRVTPGVQCSGKPPAPAYSHAKETASPGYYAVSLPTAGCLCEMTAAAHTGVQRYTFTSAKDAVLWFDATSGLPADEPMDGSVTVDEENRTTV